MVKPIFPINLRNTMATNIATTNAVIKPIANMGMSLECKNGKLLTKSNPVAPTIIGRAIKKENSADAL